MVEFENMRTGVIGVGSMGRHHARVYNEISNLVAVADPDKEQGESIAAKYGVKYFSNYEEMLDSVDAVSVAVPTKYHLSVCEKVSKSKVHILVEKPLAGTFKDARDLKNLADANGIVLSVGHIERHNSVVKEAKNFIESGLWGKLSTISARRFSSYPVRINDVGVLFDLTIHDVDVVRYLSGSEVKSVYASGGNCINKEYEDFVCLLMNFENGITGICQTNWLSSNKVREIDFFGDVVCANLDYIEQKLKVDFKSDIGTVKSEVIRAQKTEPLPNEISDFLESISQGKVPLVSSLDGLNAVKIVEAGLSSLKTGEIIDV